MTSFSWKRKHQPKLSTSALKEEFSTEEFVDEEIDWSTSAKRHRGALEDAGVKCERLKTDGAVLAETGRYWEAIRLWDEALSLSPNDARLHEMKTQALLELREDFAAVRAGEQAVRCDPLWSVAHQTVGRAQLNLGEVELALKSFCIALHLSPWSQEVRDEDISWAQSVRDKAKGRTTTVQSDNPGDITNDEFSKMDVVRFRTFS